MIWFMVVGGYLAMGGLAGLVMLGRVHEDIERRAGLSDWAELDGAPEWPIITTAVIGVSVGWPIFFAYLAALSLVRRIWSDLDHTRKPS